MEAYLILTIIIVLGVSGFIGYEICAWSMQNHIIREKENLQRAVAAEANLRQLQDTVRVCIHGLRKVRGPQTLEGRAAEQVTEILRQAYVSSAWREP
jgi:hypothetical protein